LSSTRRQKDVKVLSFHPFIPKRALDKGVDLAAIMSTIDIQAFRSVFHGQVFERADGGYDEPVKSGMQASANIPG
jgi:hypothetical protein